MLFCSKPMATLESSLSLFSPSRTRRLPTLDLKSSSFNLRVTTSFRPFSRTTEIRLPTKESCLGQSSLRFLRPCRSVQEMEVETATEDTQGEVEQQDAKRKLYVVNIPWSVTTDDLASLFGECGNVEDVEIMKTRNGQSRGFGFVTMASVEDAQAVIDKFNSFDLSGRMIRVEFARKFMKPSAPPPPMPPPPEPPIRETIHKLYVSNLAWKARSTHLRDLFLEKFKPVSSRVVFEKPAGRSAGYGFVSFSTREEAEAALSEFDGRELMGRPLRLKFTERSKTPSEKREEVIADNSQQHETSST